MQGLRLGAYRSTRNIAAERVIKLPDAVSPKTAASSLLKGMTAYMLLKKTYNVGAGTQVLIHAAAGGLGSLLVRWARSLNATVIGTVGSSEKAELAASYGANHLIVGRGADIIAEVKRLTKGLGVDVAYDGIGGDTLLKSIRSVRPFGMAVSIGQAAGAIPPVPIEEPRPGKALSNPSIMAWCADLGRYREAALAAVDGSWDRFADRCRISFGRCCEGARRDGIRKIGGQYPADPLIGQIRLRTAVAVRPSRHELNHCSLDEGEA